MACFSWDLRWYHEEIKTMLMQNFGGQTRSIKVFLKWSIYLRSKEKVKTGFPFSFGKRRASFIVKSTCVVHSKTIIPLSVGETGRYLPPLF